MGALTRDDTITKRRSVPLPTARADWTVLLCKHGFADMASQLWRGYMLHADYRSPMVNIPLRKGQGWQSGTVRRPVDMEFCAFLGFYPCRLITRGCVADHQPKVNPKLEDVMSPGYEKGKKTKVARLCTSGC